MRRVLSFSTILLKNRQGENADKTFVATLRYYSKTMGYMTLVYSGHQKTDYVNGLFKITKHEKE